MGRFGVGLILALTVLCSAVTVSGQTLTEPAMWQDADRVVTLQRMTTVAAQVCRQSGSQVQSVEPLSESEREFISTVHPLIRATLAGVYGHDIPFWLEKVTYVQSLKKHPNVMRAVVEVQTYEGAHNPYGIDTVEFQLVPGPYLFVSGVEHRRHPQARPQR